MWREFRSPFASSSQAAAVKRERNAGTADAFVSPVPSATLSARLRPAMSSAEATIALAPALARTERVSAVQTAAAILPVTLPRATSTAPAEPIVQAAVRTESAAVPMAPSALSTVCLAPVTSAAVRRQAAVASARMARANVVSTARVHSLV